VLGVHERAPPLDLRIVQQGHDGVTRAFVQHVDAVVRRSARRLDEEVGPHRVVGTLGKGKPLCDACAED
jgi:hypothetical protein